MNTRLKQILIALSVILIISGAILLGWFLKTQSITNQDKQVREKIVEITENIRSNKSAEAYSMFSEEYKSTVNEDEFSKFSKEVSTINGNIGAVALFFDSEENKYIANVPIFEGDQTKAVLIYTVDTSSDKTDITSVSR